MDITEEKTPKTGKPRRKHKSNKNSKKERTMREETNQPAINEFIAGNSQSSGPLSAKKRTPPSAEKRPEKRLIMTDQNQPQEESESSEDSESDSDTDEEDESSTLDIQGTDGQGNRNKDLEEQLSKLSPELRIFHDLMKKQLDDTITKKLSPLRKNLDKLLKDKKKEINSLRN